MVLFVAVAIPSHSGIPNRDSKKNRNSNCAGSRSNCTGVGEDVVLNNNYVAGVCNNFSCNSVDVFAVICDNFSYNCVVFFDMWPWLFFLIIAIKKKWQINKIQLYW